MSNQIEIGKTYTNGRKIVKVISKNVGMDGYDCVIWVKSKQNWTAKTSYFDVQNDNWQEVK